MKQCQYYSGGRLLRGRRFNLRGETNNDRKSLDTQVKNKSIRSNERKTRRKSTRISLKQDSIDVEELEVVFDSNGFTKEEVGTFGKLNKKPFVLVQNVASNDALAKQEVTAGNKTENGLKLRPSFIKLKKLSVKSFRYDDDEVELSDDEDNVMEDDEVQISDEEEDEMEDEYIDEDLTENFDKLLGIRQRLSSKVKNYEARQILKVGPTHYNKLQELNKISLLIEKNAETEID